MRSFLAAAGLLIAACASTAVAPSPPGSLLGIVDAASDQLLVVEPNSGWINQRVALGPGACAATGARDGSAIAVSCTGAGVGPGRVCVWDRELQRVRDVIELGTRRPGALVFTDVRSTLAVASPTSRSIALLDVRSRSIARELDTGGEVAAALVIGPGERLFTANASGSISVIDLARSGPAEVIPTESDTEDLAFRPESSEFWIALTAQDELVAFDTGSLARKSRVPCAGQPIDIGFTRDGALVALCLDPPALAWFDMTSHSEIARVALSVRAVGALLIEPTRRTALITCPDDGLVLALDLATHQVRGRIECGGRPCALAWIYRREPYRFMDDERRR